MKESLIYYSAVIFGVIVRALPLGVALTVGRVIGLLFYVFDFKNRTQAYANVKQAFARKKSALQMIGITRGMYMSFGMNIIDLFRLPLLNPKNYTKYVEVEGCEHIDAALKRGKGVVIVGMHSGSWELASVVSAMQGFPYVLFANVQRRFSRLDRLLNKYRTCGGSILLNKGSALKDIIRALKDNKVVGMVGDQGGRKGMLIPFFGRTASMNSGVIRLARKYDASIVWASIKRLENGCHKMTYSQAFTARQSDNEERDVKAALTQLTMCMEKAIIASPEEYMWIYKIWKFSDQAQIAVFSDGKMGHQRQSESVADVLMKVLHEQRKIEAKVVIYQIIYKRLWARHTLGFMSLFPILFFRRGRLGLLKWFLTQECYDAIIGDTSGFIISCGSSTAALNFLISKDHKAKSIVNLKPGLLSYNDFHLVVLPEHDKPLMSFDRCRFAITSTVPNIIDQDYLNQQKKQLLEHFTHLKTRTRTKVGVLIGGKSKDVWISERQMTVLMQQLTDVAKDLRCDLLITTSRRTSQSIDHMLTKVCKHNNFCPLLVQPNKENISYAIGGIMGLSDIIIVSGDSLSMISEAIASDKITIVFTPEMKNRYGKHMRFIKKLSKKGYIVSTDVNHLAQQIYDVSKRKVATKKNDDADIIYRELCEVI